MQHSVCKGLPLTSSLCRAAAAACCCCTPHPCCCCCSTTDLSRDVGLAAGDLRSSRQAVLLEMLRVSAAAGARADAGRKSKTKAAAAAAATAAALGIAAPGGSYVYSFSVDAADQLLLILSDGGLLEVAKPESGAAVQEVRELVKAAADVLSGAVAEKGPAYGLDCSVAQVTNLKLGLGDFGHKLARGLEEKTGRWVQRKQAEEAATAEAAAEAEAAAAAAAAAAAVAADSYGHYGRGGGGGRSGGQQQQQQYRGDGQMRYGQSWEQQHEGQGQQFGGGRQQQWQQ